MSGQPEGTATAAQRMPSMAGRGWQSNRAVHRRLGEEGGLLYRKNVRFDRSRIAELEFRDDRRPPIAYDRAEPRAETPMIPRSGA